MADISKITLPNGAQYDIKDTTARTALTGSAWDNVARQAIAGGVSFIISTDAASTPAGVTWTRGSTTVTGTLAADDAQVGAFYLVYSSTQTSDKDVYDEYVPVLETGETSKSWEKVGDTKIVSATLNKQVTNALTTATTFTGTASTVTMGTKSTDNVLGEATTATVPGYAGTTKYMGATASGTAVGADGTSTVLTDTGTFSTSKAVASVSPTTSKLVTGSVTGVTGSTTASKVSTTAKTASKATAGTAVSVATTGSAVTVADGTGTASSSNTDWLKGMSVSSETLTFGAATLDTTSVTPAAANGTITPYTFTDVSCTLVSAEDVTVPVADSIASTFATGSVASTGTGSSIVTGVSVGSQIDAVTGYTTNPGTATALTGVKVTAQPTITLAENSATATGRVAYTKSIATSGTDSVTFATNDIVAAVTSYGNGTAAGQTVTASGSVEVLKSDTSVSVT